MNWSKKDWQDLGLMVLGVAIGVLVTLLVPGLAPTTIIQYVFVLVVGLIGGYALRFGVRYYFYINGDLGNHSIINGSTRDGMGKPEPK